MPASHVGANCNTSILLQIPKLEEKARTAESLKSAALEQVRGMEAKAKEHEKEVRQLKEATLEAERSAHKAAVAAKEAAARRAAEVEAAHTKEVAALKASLLEAESKVTTMEAQVCSCGFPTFLDPAADAGLRLCLCTLRAPVCRGQRRLPPSTHLELPGVAGI